MERVPILHLAGGFAGDLLDLLSHQGFDGTDRANEVERSHRHERDHGEDRKEGEEPRAESHGNPAPSIDGADPLNGSIQMSALSRICARALPKISQQSRKGGTNWLPHGGHGVLVSSEG
jgi:hypothetical protein